MKTISAPKSNRALTLIEVLVIVAVMTLLVSLVLPAIGQARRKAQRIRCVSHLKQNGLSFRMWANDHTNLFPMSVSTNVGGTQEYVESPEVVRHFQVMSNELVTPRILVCPADKRQPADSWVTLSNTNISYFVGPDADETQPTMWLAGDRNLEIDGVAAKPGLLLLWTNSVVGWTRELHNRCGNVAMSDGSVQQATSGRLWELLIHAGVATNRLAMP